MINVHQDYIVIMPPAEPFNQPVGCVPTIANALPACIVTTMPVEPINQPVGCVLMIPIAPMEENVEVRYAEGDQKGARALKMINVHQDYIVIMLPAEPLNQPVAYVLTIATVLPACIVTMLPVEPINQPVGCVLTIPIAPMEENV